MDLSNWRRTAKIPEVRTSEMENHQQQTFQRELRSDLAVRDKLIQALLQCVAERCVSVKLIRHFDD